MARSRKHTPIAGIAIADSEKQDKRLANRRLRRVVRASLTDDDDPDLMPPLLREVSNVYGFNKDGKRWFGDRHPSLMRK